jgi:hypothetical protein
MRDARRLAAGFLLALACVAAACGAMSINELLADPAKYRNRSVTVRGTVAETASIAGRGAYRLTDGNQGLWVVTTSGAPRRGARVTVTGKLEEGYDLSGLGSVLRLPGSLQSGLVLVESDRKARD